MSRFAQKIHFCETPSLLCSPYLYFCRTFCNIVPKTAEHHLTKYEQYHEATVIWSSVNFCFWKVVFACIPALGETWQSFVPYICTFIYIYFCVLLLTKIGRQVTGYANINWCLVLIDCISVSSSLLLANRCTTADLNSILLYCLIWKKEIATCCFS